MWKEIKPSTALEKVNGQIVRKVDARWTSVGQG